MVAQKLKESSKQQLRKYDRCTGDELVKIQMTRHVLNNVLPELIERIVNYKEPEKKRLNWRRLLGL